MFIRNHVNEFVRLFKAELIFKVSESKSPKLIKDIEIAFCLANIIFVFFKKTYLKQFKMYESIWLAKNLF